jgi:hypothetical protein
VILADFRDADTAKHVILNTWKTVFLDGWLADSVQFSLESSDNGDWGMNTPSYFALDHVVLAKPASIDKFTSQSLSVYPNPASTWVTVKLPENEHPQNIRIVSISGQSIYSSELNGVDNVANINAANLLPGIYVIEVISQTHTRYSAKLNVLH